MAKFTKKEFAKECGKDTKWLSVYIRNGSVVVGDDNLINSDEATNYQFLTKWSARKSTVKVHKDDANKVDADIPSYEDSERRLKYLDTQKREKEVEKLQIEIQKKRGEVIPAELIPPVVMQHNQSIITAFKNEHDEWLRNFAKLHDMTGDEVARARGEAVQWINTAMGKATVMTEKAIEIIVADYVEKRGVGERNT